MPARSLFAVLEAAPFVILIGLLTVAAAYGQQSMPAVGEKAKDFRLPSSTGEAVQLSELVKQGPVTLVVLRGYPGYQCPACNAQTGQLFAAAEKFRAAQTQVVLVYPGQGAGLTQRAGEFLRDKSVPAGFHVVVDPDYAFTSLYGLRWNAPGETAYPSTFVVDREGVIRFAKISKSHGGRATADEILKAIPQR